MIEVQLQGEKENTCVSCATVNSLRCFGKDAFIGDVIEALKVKRLGPNGGSFFNKAAKYLRREYGMDVITSRPEYLVSGQTEAAEEVARRFEALLDQGYVGLIRRKETRKYGHVTVLVKVLWRDTEPYFLMYDSAARGAKGTRIAKVVDWVWWQPPEVDVQFNLSQGDIKMTPVDPTPTGRIALFVQPGRLGPSRWDPRRSPFRAMKRRPTKTAGANGPPAG